MKPYRFHREARVEYRAALAWYAARSLDAADGFADAIAHGIRGIASSPTHGRCGPGSRASVRAWYDATPIRSCTSSEVPMS